MENLKLFSPYLYKIISQPHRQVKSVQLVDWSIVLGWKTALVFKHNSQYIFIFPKWFSKYFRSIIFIIYTKLDFFPWFESWWWIHDNELDTHSIKIGLWWNRNSRQIQAKNKSLRTAFNKLIYMDVK